MEVVRTEQSKTTKEPFYRTTEFTEMIFATIVIAALISSASVEGRRCFFNSPFEHPPEGSPGEVKGKLMVS